MIDSTNSIGILLRGKSIEKLPTIIDKFETCFIVNWHKEEFDLLGDYILGKNVIQYTNLKHNAIFLEEVYRRFNITKVAVPYCKSMVIGRVREVFKQQKYGVKGIDYLPEKYIKELDLHPRNSGLTCIFYSSQVLKAKEIWIIGLDFYTTDYLGKRTGKKAKRRGTRMLERFVKYVELFSFIKYNILSYNEEIPKFDNLNIIQEGIGGIQSENVR